MDIRLLLENTLPGLGYELADVEIGKLGMIRVFIDKPHGVTVDDCVLVSNHLTRLLMVEAIDYSRLEVSSPGLDRPLKTKEDFKRFAGKLAKIKTRRTPTEQHKHFMGRLTGVTNDHVQLELDNRIVEIPFANIDKARLEPEL